jgi:ABC-type lipoprotein export system ATPase subunit
VGPQPGHRHPGITFFNRGGGPITFDPLNRLDRQMNAHLFLFGPTGSGKSATLNNILNQVTAIYRRGCSSSRRATASACSATSRRGWA